MIVVASIVCATGLSICAGHTLEEPHNCKDAHLTEETACRPHLKSCQKRGSLSNGRDENDDPVPFAQNKPLTCKRCEVQLALGLAPVSDCYRHELARDHSALDLLIASVSSIREMRLEIWADN